MRRPYSPKPIDAADHVAAEQLGRQAFNRLIMQGAQWVRLLVIAPGSCELVAEFRYPDRP